MLLQTVFVACCASLIAATSQPMNCAVPGNPANGIVRIRPESGGIFVAIFSCDENYELVGKNRVRCNRRGKLNAEIPTCEPVCPVGVTRVNCLLNPCNFAASCSVLEAECRQNSCGGCNARWWATIAGVQTDVTDQCDSISQCVSGYTEKPSNNGGTTCMQHSDCRGSDFCCKNAAGNNVCVGARGMQPPIMSVCPDNPNIQSCPRDVCDRATCSVPGATCETNYCAGCKAEWFKDGNKLAEC